MAHGGEGIGLLEDGRVAFIAGTIPGDTVSATLTKEKKRWVRGELTEILEASPNRVEHSCQAAAAGAGCCDFSHIAQVAQLELKETILRGQLRSLGSLETLDLSTRSLAPHTGWRTRVRLGVDAHGRPGVRRARSNDVVFSQQCTQPVAGLTQDLGMFSPHAEVVAVMDGAGQRHVVETARGQRGRRVERIDTVVEGTGEVVEYVDGGEFRFPATAFWQAHTAAPEAYAEVIRDLGAGSYRSGVAWDLYGGVGAFAPAIAEASGAAKILSVDSSPAATALSQPALEGLGVEVVAGRVEGVVDKLEAPGLVVLDPPRAGAGEVVISSVAKAAPERAIHIGCDPATFARDLASWKASGYEVRSILLIDAFPNTHHFESIALIEPAAHRA